MNMARVKVFGAAILALIIVLAGCNPEVSNPGQRRGTKAKEGSPSVTNQSLSAPTGVTPAVFSGHIQISWNAVPGATEYRIFYGEPNDNKMRYYATVPAPITSWDDNDALSTGQTYYYQVQAVNADGPGPVSDVASLKYTTTPSNPPSTNPFLGTWRNVNAAAELTWEFSDHSVTRYYSGKSNWSGSCTYSDDYTTVSFSVGNNTHVTCVITEPNKLRMRWNESDQIWDDFYTRN